jgi:hypothetical protein
MFSAALYARVCFLLHNLHTRPRVQRASGIPCSLRFEGQRNANLGRSRREKADVYLLFEVIWNIRSHGENARGDGVRRSLQGQVGLSIAAGLESPELRPGR